ncbi:MAG: DUF1549 domain-containing protein, partial [Planctomycetales bacterium]
LLYPLKDGNTELTVEFGGQSVVVPVEVRRPDYDPPICFRQDVVPVLTKSGCNNGSCHGAASGKDGFSLSLFGYDPEKDHFRLTREIAGRRINLALPAESLVLMKATGKVPHTGGAPIDEHSDRYATILSWLQAGAPLDEAKEREVESVHLYPPSAVLGGKGAKQGLIVLARYSDGTDRDVTSLASFTSSNDLVATISQDAMVTAEGRGEAFLTARYDTHTVGIHLNVLPVETEFQWSNPVDFNYIDTPLHAKLRRLRVNPAEVCGDGTFLRRAMLDLTGRVPTVDEYRQFVADTDENKRALKIDALLRRDEFIDIWTMKWADLLQMRTTMEFDRRSLNSYYKWLRDQVAGAVPLDKMVYKLLSASGGTFSNAATNYYQTEDETLKLTENVAQVFLGMRIQCAQCHNHPFDRWTMDDYYGFAAFFSQIGRKDGEDPREIIIYNSRDGEMKHPVDDRDMAPKFLGGEVPEISDQDRRVVMAEWLTSS